MVLLGALLGLIVGSFIPVLVRRWPAGEGVGGRSRCDGCGASLRVWELVPVVSFVLLRGRCARCGGRIGRDHPWIELAGAGIGAGGFALGWPGALLGWTLLALAILDVRHLWLPDRLTLPLLGLGLAFGQPPLADRLAGAAAGGLSLWLVGAFYARRTGRVGLGLGDAKLFAALGAWLGWRALPGVLLGASLIGLGWALALRLAGRPVQRTTALPFGTLLAIAGAAAWAYSAGA